MKLLRPRQSLLSPQQPRHLQSEVSKSGALRISLRYLETFSRSHPDTRGRTSTKWTEYGQALAEPDLSPHFRIQSRHHQQSTSSVASTIVAIIIVSMSSLSMHQKCMQAHRRRLKLAHFKHPDHSLPSFALEVALSHRRTDGIREGTEDLERRRFGRGRTAKALRLSRLSIANIEQRSVSAETDTIDIRPQDCI